MARVKGLAFADVQAFLRARSPARGGTDAWSQVRDALSPAHRALLDEIVAVGWYDLDASLAILEALPAVLGLDASHAMRDYARFCAERHVSRIYRPLFLLASPALLLERTADYWSRFYDTGSWKVTREAPTRARGELVGFAHPTAVHCAFLTHYVGALFERVGAKDVRSTHPRCRARGEPGCTFVVEWR